MKSRKKEAVKRVSKLDAHAAATAREYAHAGTGDIYRVAERINFEIGQQEEAISEASVRLALAKAAKTKLEATLRGLRQIVDGR